MKVFIDTNILLDFMCKREPFYIDAYTIFRMAATKEIDIVVSVLTIVNTQYTTKKYGLSTAETSLAIRNLLTIVDISPIDGQMVKTAYILEDKDKEDVIQYLSAKSVDANCIVSRDKKGFINSPIQVMTPKEFLESIN